MDILGSLVLGENRGTLIPFSLVLGSKLNNSLCHLQSQPQTNARSVPSCVRFQNGELAKPFLLNTVQHKLHIIETSSCLRQCRSVKFPHCLDYIKIFISCFHSEHRLNKHRDERTIHFPLKLSYHCYPILIWVILYFFSIKERLL